MELPGRTNFEKEPPWWNAQVRMGLALEALKVDTLRFKVIQPGHWDTEYGKDAWRKGGLPHATPVREIQTISSNRTGNNLCWLLRTKQFIP